MLARTGRYLARHHLALVAIVLSTSGTAYAATQIGSNQIIDNSVASRDIRNHTILPIDIHRGAITAPVIAPGSVSTKKLDFPISSKTVHASYVINLPAITTGTPIIVIPDATPTNGALVIGGQVEITDENDPTLDPSELVTVEVQFDGKRLGSFSTTVAGGATATVPVHLQSNLFDKGKHTVRLLVTATGGGVVGDRSLTLTAVPRS